jgi:hypothetical protein
MDGERERDRERDIKRGRDREREWSIRVFSVYAHLEMHEWGRVGVRMD